MHASQHFAPNPTVRGIDDLTAQLADAAQTRQAQLKALPHDTDPVGAAHRASVTRILDSILAAQARLAAGTYGICTRCAHRIDDRSLHLRPWTEICDRCIRR